MRASMAMGGAPRKCAVSRMWSDPCGVSGFASLTAMALKNSGQNKAALDALDVKRGDVVLEIGCGPGMGMRAALKRVGPGGFVAGVDHSALAVHYAAHSTHFDMLQGRATVMRADATDLPFRDLMFDRAFAVNAFQFWADPARALRETARVLAPRGRLVLGQRVADRPGRFAAGWERVTQSSALLKTLGWNIVDERCAPDGAFQAVTVTAERPD